VVVDLAAGLDQLDACGRANGPVDVRVTGRLVLDVDLELVGARRELARHLKARRLGQAVSSPVQELRRRGLSDAERQAARCGQEANHRRDQNLAHRKSPHK
jgi:hypothetical protein